MKKYSVMRIEKAKQKALTGNAFDTVKPTQRHQMNWTGDDEQALFELINQWDESTGHQGLNKLIDRHSFSGGTQYINAELHKLLVLNLGDGRVRFTEA